MEKTKKSSKFWLSLVIFSLVGQIAWVMENMFLNVFIYERFHASEDQIALRLARVQWEVEQSRRYDHIVINDQVETCADKILTIIAENCDER